MARVLIAGCGYVGARLGVDLAASGHEVFGLRRGGEGTIAGISAVVADLTRPESLVGLPRRLDYVFYMAGADSRDDDDYRRTYVDGPVNLVRALRDQGQRPRRLFFTSSTAVYGQNSGEWVDESSVTEPAGFSGRRLLEGERAVSESGFPSVVVRLAGIYGPGRERMIRRALEGTVSVTVESPIYANRIHRDDAAGALVHLMQLDDPKQCYLGADHEPAPAEVVLRWIRENLGHGAGPARSTSVTDLRPRANKRCSNKELRASGYRFSYPTFREGYAQVLRSRHEGGVGFR